MAVLRAARLNNAMAEVYVPGVGFRSDAGLRMPARTVVERGAHALAVTQLTSTERGTEIVFEIKDDEREAACIGGTLDHTEIHKIAVTLRDDSGRTYARTQFPNGMGLGQHEFGFFSRTVGFEPLSVDVRRVTLEARGILGDWEIAVPLAPVSATEVAMKHELDASATVSGITLRVTGIALLASETVVEFALESSERTPRACGADMQRNGADLLVLTDQLGRRYVEELSRETVMNRPREPRMYAKFPALAADASELTLSATAVIVDDEQATVDVALPIDIPTDLSFGRYRVRLGPTSFGNELPAAPGQPAQYGMRFTLRGLDDDERVVRARRAVVDGARMFLGHGWNADPAVSSLSLVLSEGVRPSSMQLREAIVRVRGPWEIRFAVPR